MEAWKHHDPYRQFFGTVRILSSLYYVYAFLLSYLLLSHTPYPSDLEAQSSTDTVTSSPPPLGTDQLTLALHQNFLSLASKVAHVLR